ncbi:peptidylprolyl isomerase [Candidatus Thioglobus sp.]|uniref:peptidylprolyl isomerase n=1 Tax=Candidatus Thioglobus sp. TaxID=2026721 RepID=UPI0032426B65
MKKLLLLVFIWSLNALSSPNSIIAIVNDDLITFDKISNEIKPSSTKEEKLTLINRQIDLALQLQKVKEVGVKPKANSIKTTLIKIAAQNNLTLMQLQALPQFNKIVRDVTDQLSLRGLKQVVLQKLNFKPTEKEISATLKENPNNSKNLNQQIKIAQIAISSIDQTDSLLQSEDELIKQFLSELSGKINDGTSFSSLAKLHSQDPSYKNGGESDWLDKDRLPQAFKQTLQGLKQGELSQPFKTSQGWRIIKIIDQRSIDMYLVSIKSKIIQKKRNDYFNNWIKGLREKAYIEVYDHKL